MSALIEDFYGTEEPVGAKPGHKKRPRTTELGVTFMNGYADGWYFGVHEVFREAMDIRFGMFVDKDATKVLRAAKGTHDEREKLRSARKGEWRRGVPPARSFSQGDVFYSPPHVRCMKWGDALKVLNAAVRIIDAQSDSKEGGWVEFEVTAYERGEPSTVRTFKTSQGDFEVFLQTGEMSRLTRRQARLAGRSRQMRRPSQAGLPPQGLENVAKKVISRR